MKNTNFIYIFVCTALPNDHVGGKRGTLVQEIWPGAGLETCDFFNEMLGELPWNDCS